MSKEVVKEFKKNWCNIYAKQFYESNNMQRREIKRNIYKNINLTEDEKDEIWTRIMVLSERMKENEYK